MHGLVSLLPKEHYQEVENIWQMLEDECGLVGIKVTPFPHFSWLIAADFDWQALEATLKEIAEDTEPFTVNTGGIGIFSGSSPVIFIPVLRTPNLNKFHQRVWDSIQSIGKDISPYYAPRIWTPHISLAYADVTQENISCAIQKLAFTMYNWEFKVDNISFIHEPDGTTGKLQHQFYFQGEKA